MLDAIALGAFGQSALLLSGILAYYLKLSPKILGLLGGFGAGALLVAIMTDLVPQEVASLSPTEVGIWLLMGAAVFLIADELVIRKFGGVEGEEGGSSALGIVIGSIVDGVPESIIFGIQLATGVPISAQFLFAIWISNVPQSFVPSSDLVALGWKKSKMALMWTAVVAACGIAAGLGYLLAANASDINGARAAGIAAGGLLAMLTNSLIPFSFERAESFAGLGTVIGFVLSLAF